MRMTIVGVAALAAACGSVNEQPDGGRGGGDAAVLSPGEIKWARSLSAAAPLGVVEGAGGLVVTGYFSTTVDLGGGVETSQGASDTVVAGFSPDDASHVYTYRFGGAGEEYGFADNVDAQGAPLIAGVAYGNYDLGEGPLVGGGGAGSDGFIGRYGPAGPTWVKRAVGPGEDKLLDTALGPSSVFAIGWYEGNTVVDTTPYTAVGGRDILFTRWNSFTGELQASRSFGGLGRDEGSVIASAGADVIAAGFFDGTLTLGGSTLVPNGGLDVWVARFTTDGAAGWATRFGGAGEERDPKLVTDAAGDVYLTGQFSAPVAFGAVNLTPVGGVDTFVAKLRGADGTVLWAVSFGSSGTDSPGDIAVDPAGNVFVAAGIGGPLEPGGPYSGGIDAAVLSYGGTGGAPRWHRVFGSPGDDRGGVVAVGQDAVYLGLSLAGPVDLGGAPIIGAPSPAGLVLKLQP